MLAIFLSCCLLGATSAESKVCFAGDGDCGGIETFGDYQDPTNDLATQCAKAGYETLRSSCLPANGQQVTDYCPYDSNYVKCCSLDYQYDSCQYPLKQTGKCGNKYKCVCDTTKYKYTANGSSTDCKNNSYAYGDSCAQVSYNSQSHQTNSTIYFNSCRCETGAYPYTKDMCDIRADFGESCTSIDADGNTETRYNSCTCNKDVYPETETTCDNGENDNWGGDYTGKCEQGGKFYFKNCLHCEPLGYKSKNLTNVLTPSVACTEIKNGEIVPVNLVAVINGIRYKKPYSGATCTYAKCPYGNRYKIFNCKKGYKPNSDNSACILLSCSEALTEWVKERGYESKYAVVGNYSSQSISNAAQRTIIIANSMSNNWLRRGKIYYGGKYFAAEQNNQALINSCQTDPTFTYTYSGLDGASTTAESSYITYFYGLNLVFTQSVNFPTTTIFYGCSLDGRNSLTFNSSTTLYSVPCTLTGRYVGVSKFVKATAININSSFKSYGYNYPSAGNVYITNKATSSVMFGNESANTSSTFSGCALDSTITFKSASLNLKGIAAFRNAYIYPGSTYIGITKDNLDPKKGYFYSDKINSVLSLYNSSFYVKEPSGAANSLYMTTSTLLGSNDSTSRVVFANATYKFVSLAQLFGYCSDNGNKGYTYVNSSGNYVNGTKSCNTTFFGSVPCREGREKNDDILCHFNNANSTNRTMDGRHTGQNNGDCTWDGSRDKCTTHYFKYG